MQTQAKIFKDQFLNKSEIMGLYDCKNYRTFRKVLGDTTAAAVDWENKTLFSPRDLDIIESRLGKPRH